MRAGGLPSCATTRGYAAIDLRHALAERHHRTIAPKFDTDFARVLCPFAKIRDKPQRPGLAIGDVDRTNAQRQRRELRRQLVVLPSRVFRRTKWPAELRQLTVDFCLVGIGNEKLAAIGQQPPVFPHAKRPMLGHRNDEPVRPHAPHRSLSHPRHRLEQPARVFKPHREVVAAQPPGERGTHRRSGHVAKIAPHVDAF